MPSFRLAIVILTLAGWLLAGSVFGQIVQSETVTFPRLGKLIVKARENAGKRPEMMFLSEKTNKTIFSETIKDPQNLLLPDPINEGGFGPYLRFIVLRNTGTASPVIMAVAMYPGGSDNGYYLTLFTESGGRIVDLTPKPLLNNIQGGWYFGYLGPTYGYGLAEWAFIWGQGEDEIHYSLHRYALYIYGLRDGKLMRTLRRETRHKYHPQDAYRAFAELGIHVTDQRRRMPLYAEGLDVND